jgi:hypothetical protein
VTSPMVAAMLEVFFLRRAGRFNGNNVRKLPKIGHFSERSNASNQTGTSTSRFGRYSFTFSWKLKKLCRVEFFFFL